MTPKLKAKELFDKFYKLDTLIEYDYSYINKETAKACAIILVKEIIQLCKDKFDYSIYLQIDYWNEVKLEIEKL